MAVIINEQKNLLQVGISESDQHVGFFWSALESFTQVLRPLESLNPDRHPNSLDPQENNPFLSFFKLFIGF